MGFADGEPYATTRGLGTHVSFVRSVTLDSWTEKQIQQMKLGGNDQCKKFLMQHGIDMSTPGIHPKFKYDTTAAELYRQVLLARVEGRPEPTEIPRVSQSPPGLATTGPAVKVVVDPSRLMGFGSSPPPERKHKVHRVAIATTVAVVGVAAVAVWVVSSL